jgi:hypothetical protein
VDQQATTVRSVFDPKQNSTDVMLLFTLPRRGIDRRKVQLARTIDNKAR